MHAGGADANTIAAQQQGEADNQDFNKATKEYQESGAIETPQKPAKKYLMK